MKKNKTTKEMVMDILTLHEMEPERTILAVCEEYCQGKFKGELVDPVELSELVKECL